MKRYRELTIRWNPSMIVASVLSVGLCLGACSASVYPASECKPPPPPKTVPNSPRSQCREVSTEHASEWPQKYKDIQYSEENAVYRVRVAYSELTDSTQRQLQSEFAQAVADVNSADGKYLQLVDAAVAAKSDDDAAAAKALAKALQKFVSFIPDHLKAAEITSGAQKNLEKANAALQELKDKVNPPAPPEEGSKSGADKAPDNKDDDPNPDTNEVIKTY